MEWTIVIMLFVFSPLGLRKKRERFDGVNLLVFPSFELLLLVNLSHGFWIKTDEGRERDGQEMDSTVHTYSLTLNRLIPSQ